jgi:hypothetical protein
VVLAALGATRLSKSFVYACLEVCKLRWALSSLRLLFSGHARASLRLGAGRRTSMFRTDATQVSDGFPHRQAERAVVR